MKFDAVLVFCSSMACYLRAPGLADVPTVVDLVDVDSQKWEDYASLSSPPTSWMFRLEGRRVRKLEALLAARARAVTLVTENEQTTLRKFCSVGDVRVVSNGVDLHYFRSAEQEVSSDPYSCVFVGTLDYRANIDGLAWFCSEVWPSLTLKFSRAKFWIVGRNPGLAVQSLTRRAGVELVGQVDDVRPFVRRAALVVAPLRVARGIQNKILEAAAMGKPIVASPQAIEGIRCADGVHLRGAAKKDDWIAVISELWESPQRAAQLGERARKFVEEEYSWDRCLAPLGALLKLPTVTRVATSHQQMVKTQHGGARPASTCSGAEDS